MRSNRSVEDEIIDRLVSETLMSAKNSDKFLQDSNYIATDINVELIAQGKQLKRTQRQVDHILQKEETSKRKIQSLSSVFWGLIHACIPPRIQEDSNAKADKILAKKNRRTQKSDISANSIFANDVVDKTGLSEKNLQRIKATDVLLDQMSEEIQVLKKEAYAMNKEISQHDTRLDVLNETVNNADNNMDGLIRKIHCL
jgi:hypothetical protein